MRKNERIKRVLFWGAVIAALALIVYGITKLATNATGGMLADAVSASDWVRGRKDAKVMLVEYADFQCPACSAYYPFLKDLEQEFGDRTGFVYRHFPLYQIHRNAGIAARAAEAAGKQGKFFEMHDMLYEKQPVWAGNAYPETIFAGYAEELGLNVKQFKGDIESAEVKASVKSDYEGGLRSLVDATPTFFLGGKKIKNPKNYAEFRQLIESALTENP